MSYSVAHNFSINIYNTFPKQCFIHFSSLFFYKTTLQTNSLTSFYFFRTETVWCALFQTACSCVIHLLITFDVFSFCVLSAHDFCRIMANSFLLSYISLCTVFILWISLTILCGLRGADLRSWKRERHLQGGQIKTVHFMRYHIFAANTDIIIRFLLNC